FQPSLRDSDKAKPLVAQASEDLHAVDWKRFHGKLHGMRIALDPGHIGGEPWDERSGKYVQAADGSRLSEGVMALELALLLEKELRAAGAEVYIDRDFSPVTSVGFEDFAQDSEIFFHN